jgi:hypothetical protein
MQSGDVDLTTVIEENDHARSGRVHRGVVSRGNQVFMTVARSDRESLEGRCMQ